LDEAQAFLDSLKSQSAVADVVDHGQVGRYGKR